jgi:hypothetical protein
MPKSIQTMKNLVGQVKKQAIEIVGYAPELEIELNIESQLFYEIKKKVRIYFSLSIHDRTA